MEFWMVKHGWRRAKTLKKKLRGLLREMPVVLWWDFLAELEELAARYEDKLEAFKEEAREREAKNNAETEDQ